MNTPSRRLSARHGHSALLCQSARHGHSALLWAAAILAAALSGAPAHYTLLILPLLAAIALSLPAAKRPCP